jgi:hypothetical protein
MDFTGIIIGAATFIIIGIMHPVVIQGYYHFGLKLWVAFLAIGLVCLGVSVILPYQAASIILAIIGISFLWGIREVFEERRRVRKGWHPANPKHDH